jgi:hypothetical protein
LVFAHFLKFLYFLPSGKTDKLARMDPPGAILRGEIGPFEVDSETHLPEKGITP